MQSENTRWANIQPNLAVNSSDRSAIVVDFCRISTKDYSPDFQNAPCPPSLAHHVQYEQNRIHGSTNYQHMLTKN